MSRTEIKSLKMERFKGDLEISSAYFVKHAAGGSVGDVRSYKIQFANCDNGVRPAKETITG
jgi:hypothetical protein